MLYRVTLEFPAGLLLDFTENVFLRRVLRIAPGGTAYRHGAIQPGDCIISANQKFHPQKADFNGTVRLLVWRRKAAATEAGRAARS